jgi:Rab-like protein 2
MEEEIEQKRKEASELPTADVKIILLGDSAVGKSKLVDRFLINDYKEKQLSTYALTMFRHSTLIEGVAINIDIWDTAG